MPSDSAHAKFLYTIIKQLDLKSIDWQLVANALEITNGHAARMRFSRFKAQMEGHQPNGRRRAATQPAQTQPQTTSPPPSSMTSPRPPAPKKGKKNAKSEKGKTEDRPAVKEEKAERVRGAAGRARKRTLDETDMADDESGPPEVGPAKREATRIKVEPRREEEPVAATMSPAAESIERSDAVQRETGVEQGSDGVGQVKIKSEPGLLPQQQLQPQQQQQMVLLPSREGFGPFGGVYPPQATAPAPQVENTVEPPRQVVVKVEPRWEGDWCA